MSIEQALAANTAAIEALTVAVLATAKLAPGAAVADKAATTKAPKAEAAPKATRDEMVATLKELGETKSSDIAKAVIKEVGKSDKMAGIKDNLVDAVYQAAKAKLTEEEAPAPVDDGL